MYYTAYIWIYQNKPYAQLYQISGQICITNVSSKYKLKVRQYVNADIGMENDLRNTLTMTRQFNGSIALNAIDALVYIWTLLQEAGISIRDMYLPAALSCGMQLRIHAWDTCFWPKSQYDCRSSPQQIIMIHVKIVTFHMKDDQCYKMTLPKSSTWWLIFIVLKIIHDITP